MRIFAAYFYQNQSTTIFSVAEFFAELMPMDIDAKYTHIHFFKTEAEAVDYLSTFPSFEPEKIEYEEYYSLEDISEEWQFDSVC